MCMGSEEYDITMCGPGGAVEFVSNSHEDAMEIISNLMEASNGYHSVKVEPPLE